MTDYTLICTSAAIVMFLALCIVIFFKLARVAIKWLLTIILNSVMGIVLFFLLRFIGISIPIWPHILPVALFGLPALATMLTLKFFGIAVF